MREIAQVVQAISDLVPTGGMGPLDRDLALAYIQWREQAASRLNAFAAMLDTGDDYQALQLAEQEPRLPDLLAHLTLSDEGEWRAYCQRHQLPMSAPLEPIALEKLRTLYMHGITTSSPFYTECLEALNTGDHERALVLIRSIVRLTHDGDARFQMERMLRKRVVPQLTALQACLDHGDASGVVAWLDEFERSGAEPLLAQDPVYNAAIATRKLIFGGKAMIEVGILLTAATEAEKQEDWPNVAAAVARARRLETDWDLAFTAEHTALLIRMEKKLAHVLEEAKRKALFLEALAALMTYAERMFRQLQNREEFALEDLEKMEVSYNEHCTVVDAFSFPIPTNEVSRLNDISALLQSRLEQCRNPRRFGKVVFIVPMLMMLIGALWVGYLYNLGQKQLRQLEEMRDGRLASAANRMLFQITYSTTAWMLNLSPETRARLDVIRKWAGLELKRLEDTEKDIINVQALVENSLEETTPEDLLQKLYKADEEVKLLAPDYLRQPMEKLARLHTRVEAQFENLLAKNVSKTRRILHDVETPASLLDFAKPVSDVSTNLASVRAGLQQIGTLEHPTIPALRLPTELNATLGELRTKTDLFAAELSSLTAARQAMIQATQLSAYKEALSTYAKLRFTECLIAASMISNFPTEDDMVARLLFGGDVDAWRIARQQILDGYQFIATALTDDERKQLTTLRKDPNLTGSATTRKLLEAIQLQATEAEKTAAPTTPLIAIVDRVIRVSDSDDLAKAYVLQQLDALIQARNVDWGLHYCPELTAWLRSLDAIVGTQPLQSGDWKSPALRKRMLPKLGTLLKDTAKSRPFIKCAVSRHDQAAAVAAKDTHYAGFVDDALVLQATSPSDAPIVFWGILSDGQSPAAVRETGGIALHQDLTALHPWSPLFLIPVEPPLADQAVTRK